MDTLRLVQVEEVTQRDDILLSFESLNEEQDDVRDERRQGQRQGEAKTLHEHLNGRCMRPVDERRRSSYFAGDTSRVIAHTRGDDLHQEGHVHFERCLEQIGLFVVETRTETSPALRSAGIERNALEDLQVHASIDRFRQAVDRHAREYDQFEQTGGDVDFRACFLQRSHAVLKPVEEPLFRDAHLGEALPVAHRDEQ